MVNTIVTIIFQISDATPNLDCSLGCLTPLIFSCLVLGAYLFFDLLYCLVGSTRRMSFFKIFRVHQILRIFPKKLQN